MDERGSWFLPRSSPTPPQTFPKSCPNAHKSSETVYIKGRGVNIDGFGWFSVDFRPILIDKSTENLPQVLPKRSFHPGWLLKLASPPWVATQIWLSTLGGYWNLALHPGWQLEFGSPPFLWPSPSQPWGCPERHPKVMILWIQLDWPKASANATQL